MTERFEEGGEAPALLLGIEGVPARLARLADRMVYAIGCDQQAMRVALLARTLKLALDSGRPALWVSPLEPSMLLRKAALAGTPLDDHQRAGRLSLLWQAGVSEPRFAAVRTWADLDGARVTRDTLVVLDHADDRFCLSDAVAAGRALAACQAWVARTGCTVIATFMPGPTSTREHAQLLALAEHFGGFAELRAADESTVLFDVRHWFGAAGAMPRASFALTLESDGTLAGRPAGVDARLSVPVSDEVTIVTARAATGLADSSCRWVIADCLLSALDACREIEAGTVVLHFDRASALREVAQTVALLRASAKPQLRVVIRECGARLRFAQTVAMMRLGVSLIVPRELPPPAARLMIGSLSGTLFTRPVETRLSRVLAQAHAQTERRLLPVDDFRARVEQLLGWCEEAGLPATLVRFSMVSSQALKAATSALQRGARDCLFAEHDGSIWTLLFGCRPEDADIVLSRLLGARFERLLAGLQRIGGVARIRHAMRLLDHAVVDSADAVFADTVVRLDDFGDLP